MSLWWKWLTSLAPWAVLQCGLLFSPVHAQSPAVAEQDLKAAYVFNFIQFIDWPDKELQGGADLTLCVSSFSPLRRALLALEGKAVPGGRAVKVRLFEAGELKACRVLVVDRGDAESVAKSLRGLPEAHGILSIADDGTVAAPDVVIVLSRQDGRVVFAVNADAAVRAGLSVSSKLMRLSKSSR